MIYVQSVESSTIMNMVSDSKLGLLLNQELTIHLEIK